METIELRGVKGLRFAATHIIHGCSMRAVKVGLLVRHDWPQDRDWETYEYIIHPRS